MGKVKAGAEPVSLERKNRDIYNYKGSIVNAKRMNQIYTGEKGLK